MDRRNFLRTGGMAVLGSLAMPSLAMPGSVRELGKDSAEEHQRIVDYLEEYGFEDVILVGELFAATRHTYTTYPDAPALIAALQKNKPCGKTILIKGSNGIKLNTVVDYL
jgi:UDP-N-acetylmuramoyl-tripeptide--D-alanyl-D-alanine ligase